MRYDDMIFEIIYIYNYYIFNWVILFNLLIFLFPFHSDLCNFLIIFYQKVIKLIYKKNCLSYIAKIKYEKERIYKRNNIYN